LRLHRHDVTFFVLVLRYVQTVLSSVLTDQVPFLTVTRPDRAPARDVATGTGTVPRVVRVETVGDVGPDPADLGAVLEFCLVAEPFADAGRLLGLGRHQIELVAFRISEGGPPGGLLLDLPDGRGAEAC